MNRCENTPVKDARVEGALPQSESKGRVCRSQPETLHLQLHHA